MTNDSELHGAQAFVIFCMCKWVRVHLPSLAVHHITPNSLFMHDVPLTNDYLQIIVSHFDMAKV